MSFDALIPFALLLIPGALTQVFHEHLRPGVPLGSDFERVFYSFLFGWPVLILNWLLVRWLFNLGWDFDEAANHFGQMAFMAVYFGGTVVFSFVLAGALVLLRTPTGWFFNWVAARLGQTVVLQESPWDIMFYDNNTQAVAVTTPDGRTRKGFVSHASPYSGEAGAKELILTDDDIFDKHAECFAEVTRTYVDVNSGTIICEYSMDAYLEKVAKAKKESAA